MYFCLNCNKSFENDYRVKKVGTPLFCCRSCKCKHNGKKVKGYTKKTLSCTKCGRDIVINCYQKHFESCGKPAKQRKTKLTNFKGKTYEEIYGVEEALKRKKFLRNHAKKNSKLVKPGFWTEERKKLQSEKKKEFYKKNPHKHPNRLLSNNKQKMSYPERLVHEELTRLNINFIHQHQVNKWYVDFYLPEYKMIIEVDGEFWHKNKQKDSERDLQIKQLIDSEIVRLPAKNVLASLKTFLQRARGR